MADSKTAVNHSDKTQLNILNLNSDILSKILIFLSPKTVATLSKTCKQLYTICSSDLLWKYLLSYQYCYVNSCSLPPGLSYKYFLQKHYYHLYPLLGLWVVDLNPYNIILKISQSQTDPCLFVGSMAALPSVDNISDPIICRHEIAQFFICDHLPEYMDKKPLMFDFSGEFEDGDKLNPFYSFNLTQSPLREKFLSCIIDKKSILALGKKDVYSSQRSEILNSSYIRISKPCELIVSKVTIERVTTSQPQLLSPGIYRGDYSIHGIELLLVYYREGEIIALKLAGDPNIPGGKVSLKCIHANKLHPGSSPELDITDGGKRNYSLPPSMYPKSFIAMYPGRGQIAYFGYHSPTFCPGMMYVADENTFVFGWNEPLNSCTLYLKCEELSKDCEFI